MIDHPEQSVGDVNESLANVFFYKYVLFYSYDRISR